MAGEGISGRKSKAILEAEEAKREAEIQERVDSRVKELFAQLKEELASPAPAPASGAETGMSALLSELVVNMKKLADPNSQKRIFSPEEMAKMDAGRERMVRLLMEAQEKKLTPVYALKTKVYLGEQKIEDQYLDTRDNRMKRRQINYFGIPSEAMIPVNDVARGIHQAFMESIGGASINKNVAPAFALSGNKVVLRGDHLDTHELGNNDTHDVRQDALIPEPVDPSQPINVLGTVAAPVIPTGGARFDAREPVARNG